MGLFNWKSKEQKEKRDKENKTIFPLSIRLSNGENVTIFTVKDENVVRHSDGRETKIKVALLSHTYSDGQAMLFEPSKYVVFDVNTNQVIDVNFMYNMMSQYYKQGDNKDICQYIGEYNPYSNEFEQNSEYVKKHIDEVVAFNIKSQIKQKEEQRLKEEESRKLIEENNAKKWREQYNISGYAEYMNSIYRQRLNFPFLKTLKPFYVNNKKYYNYNGVNLIDGKILKIRNLDKVGKDGSGTYLYAGYIQETQNETDAEILNKFAKPLGKYICFETKKRIEDIIQNQNPNEIKCLLNLLSIGTESAYRDNGELNYIGAMDKYGNVTREFESNSNAIRQQIEAMKRAYEQQRDNQEKQY